jgi:hypothetical protein
MALTKAGLVQPQGMSTVERNLLTMAGADVGRLIWNETLNQFQCWDGTDWREVFIGPNLVGGSY